MKKNLLLFLFLISLLTITYFFQEKKDIQKEEKKWSEQSFLNFSLDEILSITLPNIIIIKKHNQDYTTNSGEKVSRRVVEEFFTFLSKMNIKREFKKNELTKITTSDFFKKINIDFSFKTKNGDISYTLGDLNLLDQSFYIKVKKQSQVKYFQVQLVRNQLVKANNYSEFISKEYLSLINLLNLPKNYFLDKRFLRNLTTLKNIKFSCKGYEEFEVNFLKNVTNPSPPKGVVENSTIIQGYLKGLTESEGLQITDLIKNNETKKLCHIVFNLNETLEVYQKNTGEVILSASWEKKSFRYPKEILNFFLLNPSNFWTLRPIVSEKLGLKTELLSIAFNNKDKFLLRIPKSEQVELDIISYPEKYKNKKLTVNFDQWIRLLSYLFGSEEKYFANRISFFSLEKLDSLKKHPSFSIQIFDKTWSFYFKSSEMIVYDQQFRYFFHYYMNKEIKFLGQFDQYFYIH